MASCGPGRHTWKHAASAAGAWRAWATSPRRSRSAYALYVFKGLANGGYNLTTPLFSDTTNNLTLLDMRQLSSDNKPDIVAYSSAAGPDVAT